MRDRFYIKKITVSGKKVETSSVELTPGLNIIYGPSNKGKTFILTCIDYIFGKTDDDYPFEIGYGYDKVNVLFENGKQETVSITRGLESPKAHVVSSLENIENGDYFTTKSPQLGDVFLTMYGIPTDVNIPTTSSYKQNRLTWRSLVHLFVFDERRIIRREPMLGQIERGKLTWASLAALLHLVCAPDFSMHLQKDSPSEISAKKKGKTVYIEEKLRRLHERTEGLKVFLDPLMDVDIDAEMNVIVDRVRDAEEEIVQASMKSRELLAEIFDVSGRLEECIFLHDRYTALETQYRSDLERLRFMCSSENRTNHTEDSECPFCGGDLQEQEQVIYRVATKEEERTVKVKLDGLLEVIIEIVAEKDELTVRLEALKHESTRVLALIENELVPKAGELKAKLGEYKAVVEKRHEIEVLAEIAKSMNDDITLIANEGKLDEKFNPRDSFNISFYRLMSNYLQEMLEDSKYEDFFSARFDKDTFDAVVNTKKKKSEGKGFAAFVNIAVAFTLMRFLALHGKYAPSLMVVDSPILTLKEDVNKDEETPDGMKTSLFRYLHDNQQFGQVIIIENELPTLDLPDANVIWFAGKHAGPNDRRGFLLTEKNIKKKEDDQD